MDNKTIATIIASRRKALGLTQQALADQLHITNKAVSKWETGDGLPDISILKELAAALEISIDELINGVQPDQQPVVDKKKPVRLFRMLLRGILLLNFILPFINVPLSEVLPDWLGLDVPFNHVFGNSLQASVLGTQLMFNLTLIGFLLTTTFICHLTLLILDIAHQLDHPFFKKALMIIDWSMILIALLFIGFCFVNAVSIQIGSVLFLVFTLSLSLSSLKNSISK